MKQLFLSILLVFLFELFLSECANPKAPTGGPKDTIPPTLVEAFPPSQSLNSNEKEIVLVFDEFINAQRLSQNLIITPNIEIKYKTTTRKNELTLKFEEPFPDSTTITFNFFDGVVDITEGTPAVNLTYVFSTGDFLDSLVVSGKVQDLMTAKPKEKAIIGLFPFTDTLDIFTVKPTYFTTSDKEGEFRIANIKSGTYKLLAFADQNRNLLFDASKESYGFLANPLTLDSNILSLSIPMMAQNASTLELISSRTLGNYFDIQYSKGLEVVETSANIKFNISEDFKSVRMYKPEDFDLADSLQTFVTAIDSLGNIRDDTLFVKFNQNIRKSANFESILEPNGKQIDRTQNFSLTFNKPVKTFDSTGIHFAKDTTLFYPLDSSTNFQWNTTRTKLEFTSTFDTAYYFAQQRTLLLAADTALSESPINQDSSIVVNDSKPESRNNRQEKTSKNISNSIDFNFPEGTFISVEDDTLKHLSKTYSFIKLLETGIIRLTIITDKPSYTVQLINESYEAVKEFPGNKQIKIANILPGKYSFRILIDDNGDGIWSFGNILKNQEPESIYVFPDFTTIRANWENELEISF